MSYSVPAKNAALEGVGALVAWVSFHTADPGTTGASEVPGSTRAQTTWAAAGGGSKVGTPAGVQVPAGGPYTHTGLWTASSGGTFGCGAPLPQPETFGSPGVYNVTPTLTATG